MVGVSNNCGVWSSGVEKDKKKMKNMIRNVLKRNFSWPGGTLTEIAREARKLWRWSIAVSIFERDQN